MPQSAFGKTIWVVLGTCAVLGVTAGAVARPVATLGELAEWDPNRVQDLPKSLQKTDPNAVIMAADTVSVLPKMLTKMETVILNLTEERTHVRLEELYASVLPDPKKGQKGAPAPVHAFVIAEIGEKLEAGGGKVHLDELEALVEAVEGGPAKEFIEGLKRQSAEISLHDLLNLVEKSPDLVKDFFRPTVMTHLEHGHASCLAAYCAGESADPWSVPLGDLTKKAEKQPKPVQDYVAALPVWVVRFRMEKEAPDVPIHQLVDMLERSRVAYAKLVAKPLVTEKDLEAPAKVAYMLQEAYARSEQINTDLVGRTVVGVIAVGTLLVLLSAMRGYIKMLDVPNRRITR